MFSKGPQKRNYRLRKNLMAYVFLLPNLFVFIVFMAIPLVGTFILTFQSGDILRLRGFVGFANYLAIIHDKLFWITLRNTSLYVVMVVPTIIAVSLIIASFLNAKIRFRIVFQSIFFIPLLCSVVVAAMMWNFLLYPKHGLVNALIGLIGIPSQNWLGNPKLALPTIVVIEMWRGIGFYTIVFYAALQNIPQTMYEVALIEGATPWQRLRYVTIPLISPTILFLLVMSTIWGFQVFDSVYVLTDGGPAYSTATIAWYVYRSTFKFSNIGYGATMSFVMMVIIFVLSFAQLRLLRTEVEY